MLNFNQQIMQFLSKPGIATILLVWVLFWKGAALWKAAGKRHLVWFIILLLVNTLGLLEIGYIFFFNKWDIDKGKLLKFIESKFSKKTR